MRSRRFTFAWAATSTARAPPPRLPGSRPVTSRRPSRTGRRLELLGHRALRATEVAHREARAHEVPGADHRDRHVRQEVKADRPGDGGVGGYPEDAEPVFAER